MLEKPEMGQRGIIYDCIRRMRANALQHHPRNRRDKNKAEAGALCSVLATGLGYSVCVGTRRRVSLRPQYRSRSYSSHVHRYERKPFDSGIFGGAFDLLK